MKKDWTKKCTCENFQQNEDCEHIGNKILEEVGMQVEDSLGSYHIANTHIEEVGLGVGDKDCPDCKPDIGCNKHYIKDGDRHDRLMDVGDWKFKIDEEFDKKFKCIQGDCAGGGHTYPTEEEPEGGQCQFCAEYIFPIKDFYFSQIKQLLNDKLEEVERKLPNSQREYSFDNQEFPECRGFNNCLFQVKQIIKNSKGTL